MEGGVTEGVDGSLDAPENCGAVPDERERGALLARRAATGAVGPNDVVPDWQHADVPRTIRAIA